MTLDYRCFPAAELPQRYWPVWDSLRARRAELDSPLLSSALMRCAATARDGICVGVVSRDGVPCVFLPFYRHGNSGESCLEHLGDVQAAIAAPQTAWEVDRLLHACELSRLYWPHAQTVGSPLEACRISAAGAPFIDLAHGFDAYCRQRRSAGSHELRQSLRKQRKVNRERGPLRFEAHCQDPRVLDTLLQWKDEQVRSHSVRNGLDRPWVSGLLHDLLRQDAPDCAGWLSALWLNDGLLAAAFGLVSRGVYHGWVAAFNRQHARYSPGSLLLVQLLQNARDLRLRRIDMGCGHEPYKRSFATGAMRLSEVLTRTNPLSAAWDRRWLRTRNYLRESALGKAAASWLCYGRSAGMVGCRQQGSA